MKCAISLALLAITMSPFNARAAETSTFIYDAKGRVVGVSRSGGPINGTNTAYTYDKADNRTNVTISNSPLGGASGQGSGATGGVTNYVVIPLNGFTLIRVTQ